MKAASTSPPSTRNKNCRQPERERNGPVALVFIFFSCGEDFLRSSLRPGWLELPIVDCRLLMDMGRSCHTTFSIVNCRGQLLVE